MWFGLIHFRVYITIILIQIYLSTENSHHKILKHERTFQTEINCNCDRSILRCERSRILANSVNKSWNITVNITQKLDRVLGLKKSPTKYPELNHLFFSSQSITKYFDFHFVIYFKFVVLSLFFFLFSSYLFLI